MDVVRYHRENADTGIHESKKLAAANLTAQNTGEELNILMTVGRQQHRSNPSALNSVEFWKSSLLISFLESLITSLDRKFSK